MSLTAYEIAAAQTPSGGWTKEQLASWGVAWPPPKGWKGSLVGGPLERQCPSCDAEPGQRCVGKRGHERKAFHRGRGSRRKLHPIYAEHGLPTESPIEKQLAGAILGWLDHHGIEGVGVGTQLPVGPFRADIAVETRDRILVVECDGREYHCSEEQVARDKRRDRYFAARGISVMRFTGSEIHRDPRGCAAEVGLWVNLR